jgi:hypothetical protein
LLAQPFNGEELGFKPAFSHSQLDLELMLLVQQLRSLVSCQVLLHALCVHLEVGFIEALSHLKHLQSVLSAKLFVCLGLVLGHLPTHLGFIDGHLLLVGTVGAWSAVFATVVVGKQGGTGTGGHLGLLDSLELIINSDSESLGLFFLKKKFLKFFCPSNFHRSDAHDAHDAHDTHDAHQAHQKCVEQMCRANVSSKCL